jgi:hypothetical protein
MIATTANKSKPARGEIAQLYLELLTSSKAPKGKRIHPLRKRRRAEKIAPSCPL